MPARSGESTQPDRVDIAAIVGKIALRLLGSAAAFLILAHVLRGTSYDGFYRGIFYIGGIFLGALAIRSLPSREPALSLASDGISSGATSVQFAICRGGDHRFRDASQVHSNQLGYVTVCTVTHRNKFAPAVQTAAEPGAVMLVVGSFGRISLREALFGGVTRSIIF